MSLTSAAVLTLTTQIESRDALLPSLDDFATLREATVQGDLARAVTLGYLKG